jgi:hypothetical protein
MERALRLVNATRGPDEQLSEVHPTWVGSILADPVWAELYASDEEIQELTERRTQRPGGGHP